MNLSEHKSLSLELPSPCSTCPDVPCLIVQNILFSKQAITFPTIVVLTYAEKIKYLFMGILFVGTTAFTQMLKEFRLIKAFIHGLQFPCW